MQDLSQKLAAAVKAAAPSVVQVRAGQHRGSGVIWSQDGLILASAHCAGDADEVEVTLNDGEGGGETVSAEVVGTSPGIDLALLRVPAEGTTLVPLAFRPAQAQGQDDLAVGHLALALGRPGRSVRASLRIIGVLGPEVRTDAGGRIDRYIETDRGIPRGFSGGPLIDLEGRAIGLSTRSAIRGADLAIPRSTIERAVQDLLEHGSVQRGFLGIGAYPVRLPARIAQDVGQDHGALVIEVETGSPAEAGGLYLGDVIVSLDNEPVHGPGEIRALIHERGGQDVRARILRTGALHEITLRIGSRG